jgi:hypothetical protein
MVALHSSILSREQALIRVLKALVSINYTYNVRGYKTRFLYNRPNPLMEMDSSAVSGRNLQKGGGL